MSRRDRGPDWAKKKRVGKGDRRRPSDDGKYADGWDRIFGKPKKNRSR